MNSEMHGTFVIKKTADREKDCVSYLHIEIPNTRPVKGLRSPTDWTDVV